MKLYVLFACFIAGFLVSSPASAQTSFANESQLQSFLKTTTCVVLEDTPFSTFNQAIEGKMKLHWKITPYKVITPQEFEKSKHNPGLSFIYISLAQITKRGKGDNDNIYNILNLILGDKSGNLNAMPDLGSVPLSYEEDDVSYVYKLGGILMAMQYYVKYKIQHPGEKIEDLAKKNMGDIKSKELWLVASEMPVAFNTAEKIKKIYPYNVKMVSEQEIENALDQKKQDVVILHKMSPVEAGNSGKNQCWKFIISAENGKPLYFSEHKITPQHPDGLDAEDFKNFSK